MCDVHCAYIVYTAYTVQYTLYSVRSILGNHEALDKFNNI